METLIEKYATPWLKAKRKSLQRGLEVIGTDKVTPRYPPTHPHPTMTREPAGHQLCRHSIGVNDHFLILHLLLSH